jgi:cytochrome c-type biogenesis protein
VGVHASRSETERLLTASLLFVLGFTTVFVVLGAGAALFGGTLDAARPQLARIGGLTMILMGLLVAGFIPLPWLYRERRIALIDRPIGPLGTLAVGMAFALGWTPCIGPMLATILLYSGAIETVERGALLLAFYALGLGLPFILVGMGWGRALGLLGWARRHGRAVSLGSGALLAGLGILFVSNQVFYLSLAAQRLYYGFVR